jgi:NNP family nitrate/nitrite transporter-like MFS transporter
MSDSKLNLLSFSGKTRILHLTWFAFFLTFLVWFNHAPLLIAIKDSMGLSDQQIKTLLILNVALTIPARIIVGMLVDAIGPRRMFSVLLFVSSVLCFAGAGFVIGIRLISEWFPAKQLGVTEGIYGGWGNFGSAAAAITLPSLALLFGGDDGWRYAVHQKVLPISSRKRMVPWKLPAKVTFFCIW